MEASLGKRIHEKRKALGMTQEQLAERLSVTGQAVSKWESDISCPDITTLAPLADILGLSVDELLRGQQKPEGVMLAESTGKSINDMMMKILIKVSDEDNVNIKVNIPIPVIRALCSSGLNMKQIISMQGAKGVDFSGVDFDSVIRMLDAGACGNLMDIDVDGKDGDTVHICIVVE